MFAGMVAGAAPGRCFEVPEVVRTLYKSEVESSERYN